MIIWRFRYAVAMKKAKKGVTRDYNDCTQPEISKRGIGNNRWESLVTLIMYYVYPEMYTSTIECKVSENINSTKEQ
jgi:hypothetical protein